MLLLGGYDGYGGHCWAVLADCLHADDCIIVILNLVMGVFASRLMLKSLSRFAAFRNPALYGGGEQA